LEGPFDSEVGKDELLRLRRVGKIKKIIHEATRIARRKIKDAHDMQAGFSRQGNYINGVFALLTERRRAKGCGWTTPFDCAAGDRQLRSG